MLVSAAAPVMATRVVRGRPRPLLTADFGRRGRGTGNKHDIEVIVANEATVADHRREFDDPSLRGVDDAQHATEELNKVAAEAC